ncbi:phasin family protein [Pseudomonas sp. gcc21]|uniref:phasin family protein n=1 Tax=Pseudomonas sp. gcc21 TaxID=2726989 RepID=UPI001451A34F|nr:phasin family protein [Pseudomonas sp. gcc21]QJD60085.1 phasin family protein [Pseudomonas sp. gcc21]
MTGDKKHDKEKWANDLENYSRQIWLAGLGAYAKVGKEGVKLFETLIKDGEEAEQTAKANIEKKVEEFRSRAGRFKDSATDSSEPKGDKPWGRASGRWTELEAAFDKRLGSALSRLGMPTRSEMQALDNKIEELSRLVSELGAHRPASVSPAPAPASPAAEAVHETTDKLETEPEVAAAPVAPAEPAKLEPEIASKEEGKSAASNKQRPAKPKAASKAKATPKSAADAGSEPKAQPGETGI